MVQRYEIISKTAKELRNYFRLVLLKRQQDKTVPILGLFLEMLTGGSRYARWWATWATLDAIMFFILTSAPSYLETRPIHRLESRRQRSLSCCGSQFHLYFSVKYSWRNLSTSSSVAYQGLPRWNCSTRGESPAAVDVFRSVVILYPIFYILMAKIANYLQLIAIREQKYTLFNRNSW